MSDTINDQDPRAAQADGIAREGEGSPFVPTGIGAGTGVHSDTLANSGSPPRAYRTGPGEPGTQPFSELGSGADAHDGGFRPASAGYGNSAWKPEDAPDAHPPSFGDKIKGGMEVVEGMLTGNAEKIADGHARKTDAVVEHF